jgi:uncharacterized damage-inducible protein DinB
MIRNPHKRILGFGHPSIWKQLVHILTCEEGWVHDLQKKSFADWSAEDCPTMAALHASKNRIREATRTFVGDLTEEQLNTTPHKGQVVAMLRILGCPAPDTDLQPV